MTWFRCDDTFGSHPKVLSIPRGAPRLRAIGLWQLIGGWCAQHLTDGRFEPHMVAEMGGARSDTRTLVAVQLWHDVGQGCGTDTCPAGAPGFHQVHDYLQYNPSRDKVEREREAGARRQQESRARRAQQRDTKTSHGVSHTVTGGVTHGGSTGVSTGDPTRPDPTPSAAAAAEGADGALPPPLVILRAALEARKLVVRWDTLTAEQTAEIAALIDEHGDSALVASALRAYQPNRPIAFAQGWLSGWRELRPPGHLAAVADPPCPEPGHSGTTRRCAQCAVEHLTSYGEKNP